MLLPSPVKVSSPNASIVEGSTSSWMRRFGSSWTRAQFRLNACDVARLHCLARQCGYEEGDVFSPRTSSIQTSMTGSELPDAGTGVLGIPRATEFAVRALVVRSLGSSRTLLQRCGADSVLSSNLYAVSFGEDPPTCVLIKSPDDGCLSSRLPLKWCSHPLQLKGCLLGYIITASTAATTAYFGCRELWLQPCPLLCSPYVLG